MLITKKDIKNDYCDIISLDLGEVSSCIGIWRKNGVEIIPDEFGNRVIPSFISFMEDRILVGESAKRQAHIAPENTIFSFRRYLWRKFNDSIVQNDLKIVPFLITEQEGMSIIEVTYPKKSHFKPEELVVIQIKYMKSLAEKYLGREIRRCLMTVPTSFNDTQRRVLKDCGLAAGFEKVVRIINEPVATCLAYELPGRVDVLERYVFVFDFGGRKLDLSVVSIEEGILEVLAHQEDYELGGEGITDSLFEFLCDEIFKKHQIDVRRIPNVLSSLKKECEIAKRKLSSELRTSIEIHHKSNAITYQLSRSKFETLLPTRKIIRSIRKFLDDFSDYSKKFHNFIILGGSSSIPKIQDLVSDFFRSVEVLKFLPSQETVSIGGARQAAVLCGVRTPDCMVKNISPFNFGVGGKEDQMIVIVARNSVVGKHVAHVREFLIDDFEGVKIFDDFVGLKVGIFEGERSKCSQNRKIGEICLENIPNKISEIRIRVSHVVSLDGTLDVTIEDLKSGTKNKNVFQFNLNIN